MHKMPILCLQNTVIHPYAHKNIRKPNIKQCGPVCVLIHGKKVTLPQARNFYFEQYKHKI